MDLVRLGDATESSACYRCFSKNLVSGYGYFKIYSCGFNCVIRYDHIGNSVCRTQTYPQLFLSTSKKTGIVIQFSDRVKSSRLLPLHPSRNVPAHIS